MSEPIIKLLSFTKNPLETMAYGQHVMQNDVPDTLEEFTREHTIAVEIGEYDTSFFKEKFLEIMKDGVGTPSEYVNTVWVFKNVSRALQQQLTRYRLASFSAQTLRRVNVGSFASDGNFHIPDSIPDLERDYFIDSMYFAQDSYNRMIEEGVSIEDARGILPLNIYSTITMSCNIRVLANILKQRTCTHAQEEWKEIVNQMEQEMREKMPSIIADELFMPLCQKTGRCFFPDRCCGKVKI